jgi:superfamily II DNA or RNA helicase
MPVVELRPYQEAAISRLREHVLAGRKRVILCGPCASGKTVWAASITHSAHTNFNARVLFLVHRLELIDQTVAKFQEYGLHVGVIRADDNRLDLLAPIQVASVWTLARRPELALRFDIVFTDECHLSLSESFRSVLSLFPDATLIGLTATPIRLDGKPMKDQYDAIEPAATYSDLIRDGFVRAPRILSPSVRADLAGVHTRAGDFVTSELEEVMGRSNLLGDIVKEWSAHAGGRRTVCFAVSVAHSKSIVERFLASGVPAAHIDAETSVDDRRDILGRLAAGTLRVVSNVDILTAGWNQPSVKVMIDARPTKSLVRFLQSSGRVLRVFGDEVPLILDHACNVDRHGFPHMDREWDLETGCKPSKEKKPSTCIKCRSYIPGYPCEFCGHAPEVKPRHLPKEIVGAPMRERSVEEELAKRQQELREKMRLQQHMDPKRVFFEARIVEARTRGFKPGYASAKYKEKYEEWPPFLWGQEAKEMFSADGAWQKRQTDREAQRVHWQARERQAPPPSAEEEEDDFMKFVRGD